MERRRLLARKRNGGTRGVFARCVRYGVYARAVPHFLELRSALAAAYAAVGWVVPGWTEAVPVRGRRRSGQPT